jgi:hypothetical protein
MSCADGTPDLEEQLSNKETVLDCSLDLENYKFESLCKRCFARAPLEGYVLQSIPCSTV